MVKLIKLEYQKHHILKYIRNAGILIFVLVCFNFAMTYLGIANDPDTGVPDKAFSSLGVSSNVELLTGISFLIFAAVMHGTFIISTKKNRTMELMFSYPIDRRKILAAQMAAVCIFCFLGLTAAKLACYGSIELGSGFWGNPAFPMDVSLSDPYFYGKMLLQSASTVCVSLIALMIGLKMNSSKMAIISSFLLILFMQGNIGGASLRENILMPVILTFFSFIAAGMCFIGIEKKDL